MIQDRKTETYDTKVSKFRGLSRMPVPEDGELQESMNMTFDLFPVMSVRKGRTIYSASVGTGQGIINANGKLAWVRSNRLYYDGIETDLTGLSAGMKSMVEFWGKIFVFPDKKCYDIASGTSRNIEVQDVDPETGENYGRCPDMDYVCVHNNRIWGVKDNTIYASALGWALGEKSEDERNGWTAFVDATGGVLDSGSFVQEFASEGKFTGIASWDDRIVALKERCHHEVLGSYPSNYSTTTVSKTGTTDHRSIAEVSGRLFFASRAGIFSYAGGVENEIGRKLRETVNECVAGTDGTHYYFAANDSIFVYDTVRGLWTEESGLDVASFALLDGILYAQCTDGKIYKMNDPDSSEAVTWKFSFNDYNDTVYLQNDIKRMILKLSGSSANPVTVKVSTDGEAQETAKTFTIGDRLESIRFPLNRGCYHNIEVSGTGDVLIYGFMLTTEKAGENIV